MPGAFHITVYIVIPILQIGKLHRETLSNLPKVPWLVNDEIRLWT